MKKIILVMLVLKNVLASFDIQDPNKLLNTVDTYLNVKPFEDSFKVYDSVEFLSKICTYDENSLPNVSCTNEEIYNLTILSLNSDAVTIERSGASLPSPEIHTLTKEVFQKYSGNFLRLHLFKFYVENQLTSGTAIVNKITFENFDLNGATINAIRVHYKLDYCVSREEEYCDTANEQILLGRGVSPLSQLLEYIPRTKFNNNPWTIRVLNNATR